jgi:hypothetical protein
MHDDAHVVREAVEARPGNAPPWWDVARAGWIRHRARARASPVQLVLP